MTGTETQVRGNAWNPAWRGLLIAIFLTVVAAPPVAAKYASLVMDAGTGRVLHAVNADTRNYPASLTKMMTLYLVFEALEQGRLTLGQRIRFSRRAARQPASKLGLGNGQSITVEQAILALVTKSANDVATAVAEHLDGTERDFALTMTKRAREIGMSRTTFRNASGLPNRGQLSTARDMAVLARALINHYPQYYRYFGTRRFRHAGLNHRNHNKLLGKYAGLDGIKTGYIRASGFNLVASAERNGRRLIGVVFGGRSPKQRNSHMASLLDKGFGAEATVQMVEAAPPKPTPTRAARKRVATTSAGDAIDSPWAIQVGALRDADDAQAAIDTALGHVPTLTEDGVSRVVRSPSRSGKPYYLAQILNLGKREAYRACRTLKRKRHPCLTMKRPELVASTGQGATSAVANGGGGRYGIQVGAYLRHAPARAIAEKAAGRVSDLVDGGNVKVVRQNLTNRGPYYLARIHGLSKAEANLACRKLRRDKIDCLALLVLDKDRPIIGSAATDSPKTAAKRRPKATGKPGGDWGVQVGAYVAYAPAHAMARKAVMLVPDPLEAGTIKVAPLSKGKRRPLYRSRIVGLSKKDAYRACRELEAEGVACMELRVRTQMADARR